METYNFSIKMYEQLQELKNHFVAFQDQTLTLPWETVLNDLITDLADDLRRLSILNTDVFIRLKNNYPILDFFKICTGRQELVKYKTVKDVPILIDKLLRITQELYSSQYEYLLERCHQSLCNVLKDILSEMEYTN